MITSNTLEHNITNSTGRETFYLTTAIAYMNGDPHIGHAYEVITSDAIVRLHRLLGYDTYFVTGADEHGQKVETSALKMNRTPQSHCDEYVSSFIELNKQLCISYDSYVRTTDECHKKVAQQLWNMCYKSDDIYMHYHEGWYNIREECFVAETEALLTNYKDPGTEQEYTRIKEETYFFRMSKYTERLIAHIDENPTFIEPESARRALLSRLREPEGLRDICISRTAFKWGVPVPEGFDNKHIMYVWFDALSNYLTGVDALNVNNKLSRYWPANKHIIGKDICWFHGVIWTCMLMSARLPLYHQLFAHGFVNASDGRKMSKSYNNAVNPTDILTKYQADTIRYYMISATHYGSDLNFSEKSLVNMNNSELADSLGNMVHRIVTLCHKYCGGIVPNCEHDSSFNMPFDALAMANEIHILASECALHTVVFKTMEAVKSINKFITNAEPWKMKGVDEVRRAPIVRTMLEALYIIAHYIEPIMPNTADKIFTMLNTKPILLFNMNMDFYNLVPGTKVSIGDILFEKLDCIFKVSQSDFLNKAI